MNKKELLKILTIPTLIISISFFIFLIFYISEPEYIDNCKKKIERYDYVSINIKSYGEQKMFTGIVLQVDSNKALVKYYYWQDQYCEIDLKTSNYRIIGKSTLYHIVNHHAGFNLMLVIQILFLITLIILILSKFAT